MPSGHREPRTPSSRSLVSPRVKLRLIALVTGVAGALGVWLSMSDSEASAATAGRLGLRRVQSNMDDILGILAVPALLFFLVLAAWSAVDLVRLYRIANDPDRFRRKRRRG